MSVVKPFKGVRPRSDVAAQVACPPYDVLNAAEARELAKGNRVSFLHVDKPEIEFGDDVDAYDQKVYDRGRENLERFMEEGVLVRDPAPCFYVYRLTMDGRSQTGLVALSPVEEYDDGRIKKHEHTKPDKVGDRANHIASLAAQIGMVFTTYRYDGSIDRTFKKVTAEPAPTDFTASDGVRHELWVVDDDRLIKEIAAGFGRLPHMYIADGHHRSAAAAYVCKRAENNNPNHTGEESYNFFMNGIFPDRELHILPYNRVVKDLKGMTLEKVLAKASKKFDVAPAAGAVAPTEPHVFGLYAEGRWYELRSKPGSFKEKSPTDSIDAAIIGANFLDRILGITDPKTDKRIDFIGGIRGTKELVRLVDSGEFALALSLCATSIDQLLAVADADDVMPPKSTWFEPKLRSGMVANLLAS